ncbi:hypothetical protein GCM10023091_26420 [Ravibacter arvi]|uniref:Uncharacterized protein n=1 Tax=Ravibacter arvi TaxID=2051041 RepID=A0ABP8M2J7_9BACT
MRGENDSASVLYRDLPVVSLATGTLSIIKWFNQDPEQVNTFLKGKSITYAFHPLAGDRMGIVIYLPVNSKLEEKWLDNPKAGSVRVNSHNFQGQTVTDISNDKSEVLFSYILKDDYLIVSQHGELIEDVIRNAKSGNSARNSALKLLEPVTEGASHLSIYTNGPQWREFVLPTGLQPNVAAFLDLVPDQLGFHLQKGTPAQKLRFSSAANKIPENTYHLLTEAREGTPFSNTDYISQHTTHMIRLAVKDEEGFRSDYRKWLKNRKTLPALSALDKISGDEITPFYQEIGPEVILCINENSGGLTDSKLTLVKFGDFDKVRPALQKIVSKYGPGANHKTAIQGYEVYPILIPDLMEGLFGPLFKGFQESYVTFIPPYLVVGNNSATIRNYLIDYENQSTWTHSPDLDSTDYQGETSAQLMLFSNMNKVRAGLSTGRKGLKSSLDEVATTILSYNRSGKSAQVSLEINYNSSKKAESRSELTSDLVWKDVFPTVFSAMAGLSEPFPAILLTDSKNQLIEITSDPAAKPRILAELDGPMIGRAYRADFLNIGRPQRIVSTATTLYVLDEDDKGIITLLADPLPFQITSIDRMNDSRESSARFMLRGRDQNLYVWERVHQPPVKLAVKGSFDGVLSPVVSFARGNENHFIVTQRNGRVFVLDEKGNIVPGFPFDMLSGIGGAFAAIQSNGKGLAIQGVSNLGDFVKVGTEGQTLERRQLLIPEGGCTFSTLFDENALDWLLLRQTKSRAAILQKDGSEIFEVVNLKPGFSIRYHHFGSDNRFISVVSGGFVSIFDFAGNRIGDAPMPCQGALGLTFTGSKRTLSVFSQVEGKIQVWTIKLG